MTTTDPDEGFDVVVVGAGMAGLSAARALHGHRRVVVLDKGRGVGGRMATRRIGGATFDHGLPTVEVADPGLGDVAAQWRAEGLLAPWPPGDPASARGVPTMNALAKAMAGGLDVRTATRVVDCSVASGRWALRDHSGATWQADAAIVTAPVPQALELLDGRGVDDDLAAVTYERCVVVMVPLDDHSRLGTPSLDGAVLAAAVDERTKGTSAVAALTLRSTAGAAERWWDDSDDEWAARLLAAAGLGPEAAAGAQVHRWRYARVTAGHPSDFAVVRRSPLMLLAGDGFGSGDLAGAHRSGLAAAAALDIELG